MKILVGALALCGIVSLGACGKSGDEKLADRVENHADARADVIENRADALRAQAKQVRETGESRGDAIDAANLNTFQMSADQKTAIINGAAPAVR